MKKDILALGAVSLILSGCLGGFGSNGVIESNPVVLYTDQGPVTCELYTDEIVWWDRSISRPEVMEESVADKLCYEEGLRRYNVLRRKG